MIVLSSIFVTLINQIQSNWETTNRSVVARIELRSFDAALPSVGGGARKRTKTAVPSCHV